MELELKHEIEYHENNIYAFKSKYDHFSIIRKIDNKFIAICLHPTFTNQVWDNIRHDTIGEAVEYYKIKFEVVEFRFIEDFVQWFYDNQNKKFMNIS